jgi:hypothetical protein
VNGRDSDFLSLAALILGLAVVGILHSWALQDDHARLTGLEDNVRYLMDHTAATETEARP